MLRTLVKSPVISQMPNMPEPASATAIGTPVSRQSSRTSRGSETTMEIFSRTTLRSGGGGRLLCEEQ